MTRTLVTIVVIIATHVSSLIIAEDAVVYQPPWKPKTGCDVTRLSKTCNHDEKEFYRKWEYRRETNWPIEHAFPAEIKHHQKNLKKESGSKAEWTKQRISILRQIVDQFEYTRMKDIWRTLTPGRRSYKSSCPAPPPSSGDVAAWAPTNADVKWPSSAACTRKEYVPSSWEEHWSKHVEDIADFGGLPGSYLPEALIGWECACTHMRASDAKVNSWLTTWEAREWEGPNAGRVPWAWDVFSYHRIIDTCSPGSDGSGSRVAGYVPIEPLVGALRHPKHHCFRKATGDSPGDKNYMLASSKGEVVPPLHDARKAFFFDLGASLYAEGMGGASQEWFVETYLKRGVHFDRILAWEATPHAPLDIYDSVPAAVVSKLTYFNVPADPKPGAKHNPLRILKEITKPDDFVVIKIDIDTSFVETALLRQIMEEPELHALIDELYYEHHVAASPLHWTDWRESVGDAVLGDSYRNFTRLREVGIRAHPWV